MLSIQCRKNVTVEGNKKRMNIANFKNYIQIYIYIYIYFIYIYIYIYTHLYNLQYYIIYCNTEIKLCSYSTWC